MCSTAGVILQSSTVLRVALLTRRLVGGGREKWRIGKRERDGEKRWDGEERRRGRGKGRRGAKEGEGSGMDSGMVRWRVGEREREGKDSGMG